MPLMRFEPTIPVLKRAKTFHALDRSATVTGIILTYFKGINRILEHVISVRTLIK
jgi:hypothetical protein